MVDLLMSSSFDWSSSANVGWESLKVIVGPDFYFQEAAPVADMGSSWGHKLKASSEISGGSWYC